MKENGNRKKRNFDIIQERNRTQDSEIDDFDPFRERRASKRPRMEEDKKENHAEKQEISKNITFFLYLLYFISNYPTTFVSSTRN